MSITQPSPAPAETWPETRRSHPFDWAATITDPAERATLSSELATAERRFRSVRSSSRRDADNSPQGVEARNRAAAEVDDLREDLAAAGLTPSDHWGDRFHVTSGTASRADMEAVARAAGAEDWDLAECAEDGGTWWRMRCTVGGRPVEIAADASTDDGRSVAS